MKLKIMTKREECWTKNSTASGSWNSREREQNDTCNCASPAVLGTTSENPLDDSMEREEARSTVSESYRVLPSVGEFTIACANCCKWRLIPTEQKYEEIRAHISEQPFFCEMACEWWPNIACDDKPGIVQDGSRLWAIDRPNIPQPPPGWQRLLRIRAAGSTKFADVYYDSPSGKRLRSMVEIRKYLQEHPEYMGAGVKLLQFSFQIPRPSQEDYVKKHPAKKKMTPSKRRWNGAEKVVQDSSR